MQSFRGVGAVNYLAKRDALSTVIFLKPLSKESIRLQRA